MNDTSPGETMPRRPRISLVIPTMNEVEGMRVVMPQIDRSWADEIVVVDGGSTDGTVELCKEMGLTVYQQEGAGLPMAWVKAWEVCTGDVFVFFTPDGNSLAEKIPEVRDALLAGNDMVVVSRYLAGATSDDDDFLTGIGNAFFTGLINVLFRKRYTDCLVAFRAMTRSAITRMRLFEHEKESRFRRWFWRMNSWETGSCTRAARLGLKTAEIAGSEPKRIGGVRKLSVVKNGTGALLQILWDFAFFRRRDPAPAPVPAPRSGVPVAPKRE